MKACYERAKNLINSKFLVKNAISDGLWGNGKYTYKTVISNEDSYRYFSLDTKDGTKVQVKEPEKKKKCSFSPDGKFEVVVKEHNLYLKNLSDESLKQVTFDGCKNYSFESVCGTNEPVKKVMNKTPNCAGVLWSSDSSKFITCRIDDRKVKDLYVVQNVTGDKENVRPILHSNKYSLPGDENVAEALLYIYDLKKDTLIKVDYPAMPINFIPPIFEDCKKAAWTKDEKHFYFTAMNRYFNEAQLVLCDIETGKTRILLEEKADTFLFYDSYNESDGNKDYNFTNYVFSDKPYFIWQSQKSGYMHLYLHDLETGRELNAITSGDFEAVSILKVDEEKEKVYFIARGLSIFSDPYFETLCSVNIDGSDFRILAKEDAFHKIDLSPDSDKFIDVVSKVDMPPCAHLRDVNNDSDIIFEKADITDLLNAGYVIPRPFNYLNEDGERVYGVILLPPNIGESAPLIDYIYGGVQCCNVPKEFTWEGLPECMGGLESFAQMGFIGIIVDGDGTPKRGKAFHDKCYKNLGGSAGLKDHVYILKQLKADFPQIDLDRVGIFGVSGGGYGTFRAMCLYPEIYKVGVSISGNHVERAYCTAWEERYNGIYDEEVYDKSDNSLIADRLEGKLLIAHGDVDDNVNVSNTLIVVDQLIKHNKDFDMLIVPNTFHDLCRSGYMIRKKWDYFVKNLLGKEPPKGFEI